MHVRLSDKSDTCTFQLSLAVLQGIAEVCKSCNIVEVPGLLTPLVLSPVVGILYGVRAPFRSDVFTPVGERKRMSHALHTHIKAFTRSLLTTALRR